MSGGTGNQDWEEIERTLAAALELAEDQLPSRRMYGGSRLFRPNRAGRKSTSRPLMPRHRRTWLASGGRFRETAPGWCAACRWPRAFLRGVGQCAACRAGPRAARIWRSPASLPHRGRSPIRHHPGLSIRCVAGWEALYHAHHGFRAAASLHGDRELAGQIPSLVPGARRSQRPFRPLEGVSFYEQIQRYGLVDL